MLPVLKEDKVGSTKIQAKKNSQWPKKTFLSVLGDENKVSGMQKFSRDFSG